MTTSRNEPYDIESERALLCAMINYPECIEAAAAIVTPEDYSKAHAPIARCILEIFQAAESPDLINIIHALKDRGLLDAVGGPVYVSSLTDMGAIGKNSRSYAERIRKKADARQARQAIKDAVSSIESQDPQEAIGELIGKLQAIHKPEDGARTCSNLSARVRGYISSVEGTFTTTQLNSDLNIKDERDKANVRQILNRIKGTVIQPHGHQSGAWRVMSDTLSPMDLASAVSEELDLWLPLDLHNYASIMPGNEIIVTGDPDAGKTAFLLQTIYHNLDRFDCHYFNSEMGPSELRKRLDLFPDFPIKHRNFHAYERGCDFQDVVQPGKNTLNVIDFLEITEEFYLVAKHLSDIYKNLRGSVAIIAIQKKNRTCDLPLGAQRALEKPRLAVALSAGNRSEPNKATILKCKNRKTEHSMIGKSRTFKLIAGCQFRTESPAWA